jgi:uncharacterized membrane protein
MLPRTLPHNTVDPACNDGFTGYLDPQPSTRPRADAILPATRSGPTGVSSMTEIVVARVLHVLAVVLWIGGVGMVTTVLLPAIRRSYPAPQRIQVFHALEQRFAAQSRVTAVLAGLSGFYMAWRLNAWDRFRSTEFWWMHAMVLTWLVFTLMLFVLEPLFLQRLLARRAAAEPDATYRLVEWLHRCLLGLGLLTIAGAVAGSLGTNLFAW